MPQTVKQLFVVQSIESGQYMTHDPLLDDDDEFVTEDLPTYASEHHGFVTPHIEQARLFTKRSAETFILSDIERQVPVRVTTIVELDGV